jgi:hypothetical protein
MQPANLLESEGEKTMTIPRSSYQVGVTRTAILVAIFSRRTGVLVPILLLPWLLTACGTFKVEARLMRPEEAAAMVQTSSSAPMPAPTSVVAGTDPSRIVVEEPSWQLPSLEKAIQQAAFPLYISAIGELWRVSDIGEGRDYTVFLDYRLDDGRRFAISETFAPYHAHQWEEDQVVEWEVDVHGRPGVLYRPRVRYPNGETGWGEPSLHWHATGTSLTLSPTFQSTFARDELIAIARSLYRVVKPGYPASAWNEISKRIPYPLFQPTELPEGTVLTWVYSMEFEGVAPVTFLGYTLPDGREFYVSEISTQGHRDEWNRVHVVRRLDVHGQRAVLYTPSSDLRPSTRLALHWHEAKTAISIVGTLTQEEMVAIAESMQEVGR